MSDRAEGVSRTLSDMTVAPATAPLPVRRLARWPGGGEGGRGPHPLPEEYGMPPVEDFRRSIVVWNLTPCE